MKEKREVKKKKRGRREGGGGRRRRGGVVGGGGGGGIGGGRGGGGVALNALREHCPRHILSARYSQALGVFFHLHNICT